MKKAAVALIGFAMLVGCDVGDAASDALGPDASSMPEDGISVDIGVTDAADSADVSVPATITDETHGLMWQTRPEESWVLWADANAYCDTLELDGYSDWRLPTIEELRTLISGCDFTVYGGACDVRDACAYDCYSDVCDGCELFMGPGLEGCYMDEVWGDSCMPSWSASTYVGGSQFSPDTLAWYVDFDSARVWNSNVKDTHMLARCVRP